MEVNIALPKGSPDGLPFFVACLLWCLLKLKHSPCPRSLAPSALLHKSGVLVLCLNYAVTTEPLAKQPRIQIRRMKKRWGSLSRGGLLTLNTALVRAPKACIDYVITPELCHLCCHDQDPEYYRLLGKDSTPHFPTGCYLPASTTISPTRS